MKHKVATAVAMAGLLGVYSAGVYHFSLEEKGINFRPDSESIIPPPSIEGEHVERIMRAMQTQGPARVHTNLPVPGASCDITVDEFSSEYATTNIEVDYCLDAVYAGLER